MGKIFAHAPAPVPSSPAATATATAPASTPTPATAAAVIPAPDEEVTTSAASPVDAPATDSTPAAAPQSVDVTAIMDGLAAKSSEHLEWKKSIVDMLKLLDMDSSLTARKELATDLNYSGDESDSATMNVWLHKAVLTKLAENGGKVPAELLG